MVVRRAAWFPVAVFLAVSIGVGFIGWVSADHLDPDALAFRGTTEHLDGVVGHWLRFDANWYIEIAEHGYSDEQIEAFRDGGQAAVAFFPGYPLVVRAVEVVVGDMALSALLVTFLSGLAISVLFWHWSGDRLAPVARRTATSLLLVYPYAWYLYGSGYADALFIAAAIGAFLLVERDQLVLAGVVGIIATATRPTGVAVLIGLLAVALERRQVLVRDPDAPRVEGSWLAGERARWTLDRSRFRAADLGVLVAACGLGAYMLFLADRVGDPLAFASVQEAWGHPGGWQLWFKRSFFAEVFRGDHWFWVRLVPQAAISTLFVVSIPWVLRRFGWGYAAYTFVVVLVPLMGTSTFMGTGRYMLGAFPVFALGGQLLAERPAARRAVLVVSAVGLAVLSSYFARGYYLS